MAVKLKHLQNLNEGSMNVYQLTVNALFGNNLPGEYSEDVMYKKGDCVIERLDNGQYVLKIVKNYDGTTGVYKPEDWNVVYFTDLFKEGSALDIDFSKATQISDIQPTDRDNVTWYQPVNVKEGDGSNVNISGNANHGIIIYENEHFAAQYDEPVDKPQVRLWLDYEENK